MSSNNLQLPIKIYQLNYYPIGRVSMHHIYEGVNDNHLQDYDTVAVFKIKPKTNNQINTK